MTPLLDKDGHKYVQQVAGTFLLYARAVDSTMLPAFGSISTNQASPTQATKDNVNQLLDYAATHPDAALRFYASDMVLHIHSDTSYLSESKAHSRAGGHHYLSSMSAHPKQQPTDADPSVPNNGAVFTLSVIMKAILTSAAEAELAALFLNVKEATVERITLKELGHPQPPTPVITDNSTATGIANKTVKQRRSKAIDMRFYWLQDKISQKQFFVYWRGGIYNLADYFTKHFAARHHIKMRPQYLHCPQANSASTQDSTAPDKRGCVDSQESISLPGQCAPTSRPCVLKALQLAVRANARARTPTATSSIGEPAAHTITSTH